MVNIEIKYKGLNEQNSQSKFLLKYQAIFVSQVRIGGDQAFWNRLKQFTSDMVDILRSRVRDNPAFILIGASIYSKSSPN